MLQAEEVAEVGSVDVEVSAVVQEAGAEAEVEVLEGVVGGEDSEGAEDDKR